MTKRETFATVVTMLCESFGRPVTDGLLEGYWLALSALSEVEMRQAAQAAMSLCKFMPAAAELLAFAHPPRSPNADVLQAWQAVRKAIDQHDYLVATIDFGPLVNAVIRNLGGWDTLCRATLPELDNPGWLRKRFEEAYRGLATADPQTLHGSPLEGALPPKWDNPQHIVVAIDGKPQPPRIPPNGTGGGGSIAAHVEALAESKSNG